MIIPGRFLVFIMVLYNGSVLRGTPLGAVHDQKPQFFPPDKDKEKQFDQCAIHFYLTLGGRLSLMRVDNMVSGFQRCWSAHHTEWLDSKLPPWCTAGGLAPAVRHPRLCSEEEISRWRGPLPCQQRGEQMTFVSLDVSSQHAVRVWSEFKCLACVPLNFSLTNRNDSRLDMHRHDSMIHFSTGQRQVSECLEVLHILLTV